MKNKLEYSFDDEPVTKFCYDIINKKITVHFMGHYDLENGNIYIDKPCSFVIEKWKDGKSKVGNEQKMNELNKNIGIFSMILYMKLKEDELEMLVSTVDNRYITLFFKEPTIMLK